MASIEETGKAAIAFNATGRSLDDQKVAKAVRNKLKASAANDFFYTQSASKLQEIMSHEQFSGFYLERIKNGSPDLDEAIYAFVTRPAA